MSDDKLVISAQNKRYAAAVVNLVFALVHSGDARDDAQNALVVLTLAIALIVHKQALPEHTDKVLGSVIDDLREAVAILIEKFPQPGEPSVQ